MTLNELQNDLKMTCASVTVKVVGEDGNVMERRFLELSPLEAKQNRAAITDQLANGYCDAQEAEDEDGRNKYWAAILIFNWFRIYEWKANSSSLGLTDIDFFDWLNDAMGDAFYYRSWRPRRRQVVKKKGEPDTFIWIDNPQYKPEEYNCADKSINYFLKAKRGKQYQAANKDIRKGNTQTLSIDATFDEDGYCVLDREGLCTEATNYDPVSELVNTFLSRNKPIEAIIIDSIAHGDAFRDHKVDKSYTTTYVDANGEEQTEEIEATAYSSDFDERKLVKYLNSLDENYFTQYFMKHYKVTNYEPILQELKSLNNGKLYKAIERTIVTIKSDKNLLSMLS